MPPTSSITEINSAPDVVIDDVKSNVLSLKFTKKILDKRFIIDGVKSKKKRSSASLKGKVGLSKCKIVEKIRRDTPKVQDMHYIAKKFHHIR
ncbi:hypothetical protein P3S68_029849 [Capsicum galapagoense]